MEIKIHPHSVFTYDDKTISIGIHTHSKGKYTGLPYHEGDIVFNDITQIEQFQEMIELLLEKHKEKPKCQNCQSIKIKYKEWSPDGPPYYFCSKKCYKKHKQKGGIYRALPLEVYKEE